ncbi:4Fe-4S binding protein [Clostridium sp. 'deep sea']|uniref:[Fe-Fe] hydrogenase large subunit C-terminal domain-containing protein n=1 Tax=Clostridium sp. 'deep sea' TaxID=2779445 RepID=UPI0018969ED1|nr:[Fe-Fe] hydrogenase large subunit C-terminal domain-containing protein [Clostridium sp. 'deep sea']QOR36872.1 4Fe-4S binding protein [Clostridium sp. 'deep sea']
MNLIRINKNLCDNCFKCLRVCPTKAIKFHNNERIIDDDMCIKCGLCHSQCSQNALEVVDQYSVVKSAIASAKKTVVSLAPSYVSAFDIDKPYKIVAALKEIGFDYVEETSIGAEIVYKKYSEEIKKSTTPNVITTCCPSATYLVESHYPNLIDSMLKVVSPMTAHGKDIKRRYGDDCFVVFIGPCLAKIVEAHESAGDVDAVLTFAQLDDWLKAKNIDLQSQTPVPCDRYGSLTGKAFPLGCVVENEKYQYLHVDGIENCKKILDDIIMQRVSGLSIELNICEGSCINGPEMPVSEESHYVKKLRMQKHLKTLSQREINTDIMINDLDLTRVFHRRDIRTNMPTEEELNAILRKMRKYSEKDQLNCGACGYDTCVNKAISVFNEASNCTDCMPYLREIAEEEHSLLIENSPNGICVLDAENIVKLTNPKFDLLFNRINGISSVGLPIDFMVSSDEIDTLFSKGKNISSKKIYEKALDKYFLVNTIHDSTKNQTIVFFTDISSHEKNKMELERMKQDTLEKTSEVIYKQMRVVQKIAGLLGETTAETKMSLNELRDLIIRE